MYTARLAGVDFDEEVKRMKLSREAIKMLRRVRLCALQHGLGDRRVDRVTAAARAEITADIAAGVVPRAMGSFDELHDHVDANEYGAAACAGLAGGELIAVLGPAQDALDRWLRAGRS